MKKIKPIHHLQRSALALGLLSLLLLNFAHPQEPTFAEQREAAQNVPPPEDVSLIGLYLQGGPLMHVLALASVATFAIGGYCALQINRRRMMPAATIAALNQMMAQRQVDEAYQLCRSQQNPLTNTVASALIKANFDLPLYNKPAMEQAAADTLSHEETRLNLWVNYLNVCATLAPMIGLLGTVSGMITAFNKLAAGLSQPEDLAGGIGEAMVTTAGGLLVGIPSMFLFFFFRNNLQSIVTDIQKATTLMLDLFSGEVTMNHTN